MANTASKGGNSPLAARKAFTNAVRIASAAERSAAAAAREDAATAKDALAACQVPLPLLLPRHSRVSPAGSPRSLARFFACPLAVPLRGHTSGRLQSMICIVSEDPKKWSIN